MSKSRITAVSLFASSGIGDLALRAAGGEVLVANEFLKDRAELFQVNYPEAEMIVGDIRQLGETIVRRAKEKLNGAELDILFATPPCQGMSKNGRGKLLRGVRDGLRDAIDPRNQLATYVPAIVNKLKPKIVIFENVPEMLGTLVENINGDLVELVSYLSTQMKNYLMTYKVVEFANYGVPQRRQRLITVFVRKDIWNEGKLTVEKIFPNETHSAKPSLFQKPWITVDEVIGGLPKLDASNLKKAKSSLDFHYVPVLDEKKYWWVSHTPVASSAFDNQCINPKCLFDGNETHGSGKSHEGINQSKRSTPLYCEECGELLPRPSVEEDGQLRLMKGFTSAYKRMRGDYPASAITTNLSYVMSDSKIHPTQHRALSLLEAMRLHTITDYEWSWKTPTGDRVPDKIIRDSLGESIPPRALEMIFREIFEKVLGYKEVSVKKRSA